MTESRNARILIFFFLKCKLVSRTQISGTNGLIYSGYSTAERMKEKEMCIPLSGYEVSSLFFSYSNSHWKQTSKQRYTCLESSSVVKKTSEFYCITSVPPRGLFSASFYIKSFYTWRTFDLYPDMGMRILVRYLVILPSGGLFRPTLLDHMPAQNSNDACKQLSR